MRGSTAGLADSLASGSRAHGALLEFADAFFGSAVVGPAVVTYWKATWSLMDLYLLPQQPVPSAIAALAFGFSINFLFCVFQVQFSKKFSPDKGRLKYYALSRLYTWIAAVACVGVWRGVWNLLDECTGDSAQTVISITAAATLCLAALRTLKNIIAAPFAVFLDSPKDFFVVPTMFKTNSKETGLYILDCAFSVTVVGSLVVFVWRGFWTIIDIFLYPDNPVKSCWNSLILGYAMVVITFSLQAPMRWIVVKLPGAARLLLADVFHFMSFAATANVWRGIRGLLDIYFFPDTPALSNWSLHIASMTLLILLNCSNSILVRGVYIDAEESGSDCVEFPCHYFRLFFNRTKQNETQDSAAKKKEEASLQLQTRDEKA